ncbi:MAG: acetolactate synthase small subunit [Flavobacteriales bacterium]|nr:acetolactate synthase small subunit [Flavobacteriales bacterium]MCB9448069.1 acetolactate synthase small subunit [Flavobacteriales bacterium]
MKELTISVYTENFAGLLNKITIIFNRRKINIESLTVSESEVKGIHRFTIVVNSTRDAAERVVKQIEKVVEVFRAFVHEEHEVIHQEIALYKVPTKVMSNGGDVERLIRDNHARILAVEPDFMVIEKTGHKDETQALYNALQPYGVLQFVRSGRVAVTKPIMALSAYLRELDSRVEA